MNSYLEIDNDDRWISGYVIGDEPQKRLVRCLCLSLQQSEE